MIQHIAYRPTIPPSDRPEWARANDIGLSGERAVADLLIGIGLTARMMGCSAKSLQNWNVPCVKLGSRLLYRVETLRAWSAERETVGEPTAEVR